jgi:hypothetical protein
VADKIVCALWPGPRMPGSVKVTCVLCRRDASLSPQGQAFVSQKPDSVIVCTECGRLAQVTPTRLVPGAAEAALAELRRRQGK